LIDYDKEKHEDLLIAWYYAQLRAEPEEFAKLFMKPLRSLTALLNWAAHTVHLMLSVDERGIWGAAWVDPFLSGAYFGYWCRKDKRGTIGAYALIRHAQRDALKVFPILIGVTKQPALHKVHLALGYELVGKLEKVFDGDDAWVYKLTAETMANGRRVRKEQLDDNDIALRAGAVGDGQPTQSGDDAGTERVVRPHPKRAANGRRKLGVAPHQPSDRRRKRSLKPRNGDHAAEPRAGGP
jgi:hypothetical protein